MQLYVCLEGSCKSQPRAEHTLTHETDPRHADELRLRAHNTSNQKPHAKQQPYPDNCTSRVGRVCTSMDAVGWFVCESLARVRLSQILSKRTRSHRDFI